MLRSPRVLVAARVLAGMSQPELAAAAGIAVSVLQAIEQGRSDPRLSTVLALVDALKARGINLVPETEQVAWGVLVTKGSEAERLGIAQAAANRAEEKAKSTREAAEGDAERGNKSPLVPSATRRTQGTA
ncbi:helix-turn-helix transcriptional regulator [Belnapia moabensis]|uniref:helix-turn-helix transcriptional regulator n=1 Tax=Belnapia moabensis TaxID=365533 RepID=UPI0005BCFF71|nr:helix-turn-helix transcriptional regulator [Belnapia moabensis]